MAASCAVILLGIGVLGLEFAILVPGLVTAGLGMGMLSGCINPVAVAQVDRDHAGAASGLLKTGQQAGAALGIALVGSAYFAGATLTGHPGSATALYALLPLLLGCALLAAQLPATIFAKAPAH